jgi:hypothetical protein
MKSFKFWALLLVLLYTAFGFIAIPWFLVTKAPHIIKDKIGLHVQIKKASFNPYSFELSLGDILIKDLDLKPAIELKKIYVNYTPLALYGKTILFQSLEISSPKIYARIEKSGKINFENLIPKVATKDKPSATPLSLPIIALQKLIIKNGNAEFLDMRGEGFKVNFGPSNFNAYDITTEEGMLNAHHFTTTVNGNGTVTWEGGMSIHPLKLYGLITIENLELPKFYSYLLPNLPARLKKGNLSLSLPYHVNMSEGLHVNIEDAKALLTDVSIVDDKSEILSFPQTALSGFALKWPEQDVLIDNIAFEHASISSVLEKSGKINLVKAFALHTQTATTEKSRKPWSFLLKEFDINETQLSFMDSSLKNPLVTRLENLSLHVQDISSHTETPIRYQLSSTITQDAHVKVAGDFTQKTNILTAQATLSKLHVSNFINYLEPFINFKIKSASIDGDAKIVADFSKKLKLKIEANTAINALATTTFDQKNLIKWKKLTLDGINYVYHPLSLNIKALTLNEPHIRVHIAKDHSTNFSNLLRKNENVKGKGNKNSPFNVKIGPIKLVNGTTDFSDLSLPFPFKTYIHSLNGEISALDFGATTPSLIALKGKIDTYGYADIKGKLIPLKIKENSTINVLFKNIDLNSLTPYSSKFVGYKIKSGKLSMDLTYNISKAALVGSNKINIDTITLGGTYKSPDAVSLPLELALALLKDSNGQIDLNLPVSGDMNNPEFSYSSVLWKAVGNMITGIVTAPFRFLGSLVAMDGDSLKAIDFDQGSFAIISTEHEKLANLQKILGKRPAIKIKITGGYDEIVDGAALQKEEFAAIVKNDLAKIKTDENRTQNNRYGMVLKNLYIKSFIAPKYEALKKSFIRVEKSEEPTLDVLALNKKMQNELTATIKISNEKLVNLANKRASLVQEALISTYKIDPSRLITLPSKAKSAKRDRWIETELEIAI